MARFIQCPQTFKLIPAHEYCEHVDRGSYVLGDIKPFVSPIDGTIISDRSHLRAHNKKHGVTDMRDYGQDHFDRAAKERAAILKGDTKAQKAERIEALQRSMYIHGA